MNWLDFAIITTVAAGALVGMRIGFLSATITALGVMLGLILVGQVRGDVTTWLAKYLSDETRATVFGYLLTVGVSVALAVFVAIVVKRLI